MKNEVLEQLRTEYSSKSLDESTILKNPILQFEAWFHEAIESQLPEPNAMTLATAGIDYKPSARMVLLKRIESQHFFSSPTIIAGRVRSYYGTRMRPCSFLE